MAWKIAGFCRWRTAWSVRSRMTGSRRSVGTRRMRAMAWLLSSLLASDGGAQPAAPCGSHGPSSSLGSGGRSDRSSLALPVEQTLFEPRHQVVGADSEEGEDDQHHEDAGGVEGAGGAGEEEAQAVLGGEHLTHHGGGEGEGHGDAQPREDPGDARREDDPARDEARRGAHGLDG